MSQETRIATETPDRTARRRHAAGEDPQKRDQILLGAEQVFMERGFDAASMGDVCRLAGVSKGTLYVYFQDKADLFVALVERKRDLFLEGLEPLLDGDGPLRERLGRYGRGLAEVLCSDQVIRAQRTVIGIVERMPDLGARFYEVGAERTQACLRRTFQREVEAGRLAVPDLALAAQIFVEMVTAGLWRPRLFGKATTPPTEAEIARRVDVAVGMILAAYGLPG